LTVIGPLISRSIGRRAAYAASHRRSDDKKGEFHHRLHILERPPLNEPHKGSDFYDVVSRM